MSVPLQVRLDTQADPPTAVAAISGDACNTQSDQLTQALAQLAEQPTDIVVLDLSGLKFIASVALAQLIEFHLKLKQTGKQLRIAGASPQIEGVFRTTQLIKVFPLYPSIDDALPQ